MNIRYLFVVLLFVIGGCSEEQGDWIEVPLQDNTYYSQTQNYRQDEFDIPVAADQALEFKLHMGAGDIVVYHWSVDMEVPALLTVEFHGHTERQGDEPGTVMFYKRHNNGHEEGSLVAPFDGIHGWYLRNDSSQDIVVKLAVAGFFEEVKE
jgi:hypothetical protein